MENLEKKHLQNLDIFNDIQNTLLEIYNKDNKLIDIKHKFDNSLCIFIINKLKSFIIDANKFICLVNDDLLKNTIKNHINEFNKLIFIMNSINNNNIKNVVTYIKNKIYQDNKVIDDLKNLPKVPTHNPLQKNNLFECVYK